MVHQDVLIGHLDLFTETEEKGVETVRCVQYNTYRGSGRARRLRKGGGVRGAINNHAPHRRPQSREEYLKSIGLTLHAG